MDLCCGIDIGNAKTEIAFMENNKLTLKRQPSVISQLLSKPESFDVDEETIINNLLNGLSVHIFSPALKRDGIFFVGNKALKSQHTIKTLNIKIGNKATQDIPVITSLSMIAGIGIQNYYHNNNNEIPDSLTINTKMVTAIPSSEYTKESAKKLEDRFINEHTVNVYIGTKTVLVNINITHCKVTEEGKTAMLAFLNSSDDILKIYNSTYNEKAKPIDFADALALHIDIGDGTSEFVFTTGANPVPNGSFGERVGVGHATNEAIKLYREELGGLVGDITRQHFITLMNGTSPKSKVAKEKMKQASYIQGEEIIEKIEEGFQVLTSSSAEYFFVHGGGSIVFKEDMYDDLLELANTVLARVVWIPKEFATSMNSRGTFYLAQVLYSNDQK